MVRAPFAVFFIFVISLLPAYYCSQYSFAQSDPTETSDTTETTRYHEIGIDAEYPSDWPYKEDNASVTFYPREVLLNNSGRPSVFVSIGFIPLPYHNLRIDDFATIVVNDLNRTHNDFQLIENRPSNTPVLPYFDVDTDLELTELTNLTTANPYSIVILNETTIKKLVTDEEPSYELSFTANGIKTLVVYTKIDDNFVYYATYVSPVSQYDRYLPSAQKVIDSFTIDKPNFDSLMTCRFFKENPSILNNLGDSVPIIGQVVTFLGSLAVTSC